MREDLDQTFQASDHAEDKQCKAEIPIVGTVEPIWGRLKESKCGEMGSPQTCVEVDRLFSCFRPRIAVLLQICRIEATWQFRRGA